MEKITGEARIVLRDDGEGRKAIIGLLMNDIVLEFPEGEMFQATITITPTHHWVPKGKSLKGVSHGQVAMMLNKDFAWEEKK